MQNVHPGRQAGGWTLCFFTGECRQGANIVDCERALNQPIKMAGQRHWTNQQERWSFLKAAGHESSGVQKIATTNCICPLGLTLHTVQQAGAQVAQVIEM